MDIFQNNEGLSTVGRFSIRQNTSAKKHSEETVHKNTFEKPREPLRFLFISAFLSVRIFEFSQDFEFYPINGT